MYTDFGNAYELDQVIKKYRGYYKTHIFDNKNSMVSSFKNKDFDKILPLMQHNEKLEQARF